MIILIVDILTLIIFCRMMRSHVRQVEKALHMFLLMDLYEMSTKVIGFTGIFLRANENGIKLYKRKIFIESIDYMVPFD